MSMHEVTAVINLGTAGYLFVSVCLSVTMLTATSFIFSLLSVVPLVSLW